MIETATFVTSVIHTTAIERKPFYHFRPGTSAITLAAPGCTFRCDYCINYRISQAGRLSGRAAPVRPVDPESVVNAAAASHSSVALSYSEPALAPEMTLALARAGKPRGVPVVWKTNGFLSPAAIDVVAPVLAAVNVDLKSVDEERHVRLTGAPPQPVVEAIRLLHAAGVWVEVSTPLIPGVSSDTGSLQAIAQTIAGIDAAIPWHLLRFTPTFRMSHADPTPPAALEAAVDIGRAAGLRYVYVERALGDSGRATCCPRCGHTIIRRAMWGLAASELRAGCCPYCDTKIEGRW